MESKSLNWKKIIILAGAFCSYCIGSGFASGQEILQFFASYGLIGVLGACITLTIFIYFAYSIYGLGKEMQFKNPFEVYQYYSGKAIGTFYEWYSIALFYGIYVVMVSGAGASIHQYLGIPAYIGGLGMATLAMITVLLGLEKLVNIIGCIGPVIIIFTIIIGVASIASDPGAIFKADKAIETLSIKQASPYWFLSAILYPCFCIIISLPFMVSCGASTASKKEARVSGVLGVTAFVLAIIMIILSELIHINDIATTQIPTLVIADKLVPILALCFSIIIMLGIYTTAAPLLWSTVRKFAQDRTKKSVVITLVLSGIGMFFGGLIPFDVLVNTLYPLSGYLAIVFMGFMIVKQVRMKNSVAKNTLENKEIETDTENMDH